MSAVGHRSKASYDELEHDRHRDRRRSRSRSRSIDHHYRRRRSRSHSNSRNCGKSSSRHHSKYKKHSSRYHSRRYEVSRSKSRSRSRSYGRRDSRCNSCTRSRSRRSSRTPTRSHRNYRSRSHEMRMDMSNRCNSDNIDKRRQSYLDGHALGKLSGSGHSPVHHDSIEYLPLPSKEAIGAYYNLDTEEPIDKEKIHREMEEKLRAALAKEGKVYPPPKPEPSHPVFANDGSFIEIFKKMQQAQKSTGSIPGNVPSETSATSASVYVAASATGKPAPPPPIVGRRRGGKILKTGVVAKPKAHGEDNSDPKDFWSIYLREVNKYKNNACDTDGGTRPLVK